MVSVNIIHHPHLLGEMHPHLLGEMPFLERRNRGPLLPNSCFS